MACVIFGLSSIALFSLNAQMHREDSADRRPVNKRRHTFA
jgi:hypothetical protein